MKVVISLNGVDGSGKTTQVELLYRQNPNLIKCIGGLENFPPYMTGVAKDFNWWFLESTPVEFCDVIYESMYYRNLAIVDCEKPIVLIDKGLRNFEARILSTLLIKGLSVEESKMLMTQTKAKFGVRDYDNISFFLSPAEKSAERMKISSTRAFGGLSRDKSKIYKCYQQYQNEIINNQLSLDRYVVINASGSIEEVNFNIKKAIYLCLKEQLFRPQAIVIGLGGLSECGKSGVGKYLSENYDCWNLKLKYLVQIICEKYNISSENEYFTNDILFTSILEAEEIARFLQNHYYKRFISVESLHNKDLTLYLKDIFGAFFQIWYIDTSLDNRVRRNAKELEISIDDSSLSIQKKDAIKYARGSDKIKSFADVIIDNNNSMITLFSQIDHVMGKYISCDGCSYTKSSFSSDNIPKEYSEVIYKFYNFCKEILKHNLKLILLHGSCQRETVIAGFSDIDFILVVEKYDQKVREVLNKIIIKCDTNIKIGTTVYSLQELSALHVDGKTLLALYKLNNKFISALYLANDVLLPIVDYNRIIQRCISELPGQIHSLRRMLYDEKCFDSYYDNLFKSTSHIMRRFLLICKIDPDSYEDVFRIFATTYKLETYDVHIFFEGNKRSIFKYSNYFADVIQNI